VLISFSATKLCRFVVDCICVVSLSLLCSYSRAWETQVSVFARRWTLVSTSPCWKKCSSQSKGFLEDFSLYGQGGVEGLMLFFKGTRRQSAAVIVWVHTSPAYVGAPVPTTT
jgi:hypothetical protein